MNEAQRTLIARLMNGKTNRSVCLEAAEEIKELRDRIEELESVLETSIPSRVRELEAALRSISTYPDPDFPMEDEQAEADRAWQIIYVLKGMADEATKGAVK